ncbi:dienelactone hydrolase family protein [Haloechinothrix salitolerans]
MHAPDLYDGTTFATLTDGIQHAQDVGFDIIVERGRQAADDVPPDVVYIGLSLGAMPAQTLAQTRPGARGVVLLHGCVPTEKPWPDGLPLQIHTMADDAWGDVDVARQLADTIDTAELFLYPGDQHLFTDNSLPSYDPEAADLALTRVLSFLDDAR